MINWERVARELERLCIDQGVDLKMDILIEACTVPPSIVERVEAVERDVEQHVVDIETASLWGKLSTRQRAHLEKLHAAAQAKDPSITESAQRRCALQASTGKIIVIAMLNPGTDTGVVMYEGRSEAQTAEGITWIGTTEADMLMRFWQLIKGHPIVTYNGFSFDAPYIICRSMQHGIPPTQRIAPRWYERERHLDIREELSCFGRMKVYDLAFTCELYGVPSPKGAMDGSMVEAAYQAGEILKIAEYCLDDVEATATLLPHVARGMPFWTK